MFLRRFSSRSILFFRGLFDFVESKKSNLLTSGKAYENNTPRRNVFVLSHLISFTSRFSRSLFNLGMSKLLLPTFSMWNVIFYTFFVSIFWIQYEILSDVTLFRINCKILYIRSFSVDNIQFIWKYKNYNDHKKSNMCIKSSLTAYFEMNERSESKKLSRVERVKSLFLHFP